MSSERASSYYLRFLTAHPHPTLLADGASDINQNAEPDLLEVLYHARMGGRGSRTFDLRAWLKGGGVPASVPQFLLRSFGAGKSYCVIDRVGQILFESCTSFSCAIDDAVGEAPHD